MNWLTKLRTFTQTFRRSFASQHADLIDREHLWSLRGFDEAAFNSHYSRAAADFASHVWVQKAVRVWADSLGPLRLQVLDGRGVQLNAPLDNHPLLDLLENPNPAMSRSDVWRWWATDMALGGECGFEFVRNAAGRVVQLYPRQPDFFHVRPVVGNERYLHVSEYILDPDSSSPYSLSPNDFLHFKFYNPLAPFRGLPPAAAVRQSILIDQLVQSWSRMFFRNSARPDYAIIAPQGLTDHEKREIEFRLASRFGGPAEAHKPLVLEQGVQDIKVFSFPRKDLEWLQQRQLSRDEIGAIWGVPDEIMGYGRDTYENFDTAERVLWSLTLINLINFRDEHLTRFCRLQGLLARGQRVATDLSRVWALRRAAAQQMQDAESLFNMGVPFNTIDTRLGLGIGPVPGGDKPGNKLPNQGRKALGPKPKQPTWPRQPSETRTPEAQTNGKH